MRTGELLVRVARAVRAIGMISLRGSLARIEHGQTNQKLTIRASGYNKKNNALAEMQKYTNSL
jgi:autonomous glycyl radical cofactor GrcA